MELFRVGCRSQYEGLCGFVAGIDSEGVRFVVSRNPFRSLCFTTFDAAEAFLEGLLDLLEDTEGYEYFVSSFCADSD